MEVAKMTSTKNNIAFRGFRNFENQIEELSFHPVGLPCGKAGPNPLFTTNLFYGKCPHSCLYCYATGFGAYSGDIQPVTLDSVKMVTNWPRRLFLSSASDPFHPLVVNIAEELLRRALEAGTFVVISTKALATNGIKEILSDHSDLVSYTVSLSSLNDERNALLEPYAPDAVERLHGKKTVNGNELNGIEQLVRSGVNVTLKADCIFPCFDDSDEAIASLLNAAKGCGVRAVNFSYVFYRNGFKNRLTTIPLLNEAIAQMTEEQSIASGKGFSLPLDEKAKRLSHMGQMAKDIGFEVISTCKCKNQISGLPGSDSIKVDCHFHDKWWQTDDKI
jgi:DNA repair photolyase